jgi:hypothetical protein
MKHVFAATALALAAYESFGVWFHAWPTITELVTAHPVLGGAFWAAVIVGVTLHFVLSWWKKQNAK